MERWRAARTRPPLSQAETRELVQRAYQAEVAIIWAGPSPRLACSRSGADLTAAPKLTQVCSSDQDWYDPELDDEALCAICLTDLDEEQCVELPQCIAQ